jgi:long-chain acyl-CoA synthetase
MTKPWIKSYPRNISWDEVISAKPVFKLLEDSAKNFPDKPAIDFLGKKITYFELLKKVNNAAKSFRDIGVKEGVKVGIYAPNCPHFVIAYYAILKAGGVVVNYSPLYSEEDLEFQIKDSDTEIMFTLDLNILYPKLQNVLRKTISGDSQTNLKSIIVGSIADYLSFPKNILFKYLKSKELSKVSYNHTNILNWNEFIDDGMESETNFIANIKLNDTAVIQYTGGTTGRPKGAELSHESVYTNAIQCKKWCNIVADGEGSILTCLPLFHVFAMTAAMNYGIASASKIILHPRFEIEAVLKDIQSKKPTAMPGVSTMFNAINNYKDLGKYKLSSLRFCISGGGPLPVDVKKRFEEKTGCKLVEGYGLTESSPVACCNPITGVNKAGSIGLPFPNTEILIEDMENPGNYLGIGKTGEICIKGPQVMKGYYKRADSTAKVMNENGSLKTGDVGYIDEDGYVFIVDRLKEMIISGGFKIYPRHVEEKIYEHPAVLEAAVVGVDDEYSGQKVKAYIALKEGCTLTADEMINYLKEKVSKYQVPKEIEFRASLPKTMVGKISKKDL